MMNNGNDVLDKEMDIVNLVMTIRQNKTFIQKNFTDWKKYKEMVPKDEAKKVLKMGGDSSSTYRVKHRLDNYLQEEKEEVE